MDRVLAVVNNKEITEGIVMKFLNDMGPQAAMQFQSPEGIKKVVEELVNQELIYLNALEKDMNKEDEFVTELKKHEEGLLKQYAISKLLSETEVTEGEIIEYYNNNKNMFLKPETVSASHILVDKEELAKEVLKEIEEGLSFTDAAKKYSTCPSKEQGGSLGEFGRGQMVPEFEEAAFDMEVNSISEPIKSQFGYHIINLLKKSEEGIYQLDEVKSQLSQQILAEKQEKIYIDKTNELKEKYDIEFKI